MLVNIYADKISPLRSLENQKSRIEHMIYYNSELDGLHAARNSDAETFAEQQPESFAVEAEKGLEPSTSVTILPEDIVLYVN